MTLECRHTTRKSMCASQSHDCSKASRSLSAEVTAIFVYVIVPYFGKFLLQCLYKSVVVVLGADRSPLSLTTFWCHVHVRSLRVHKKGCQVPDLSL